MKRGPHSISLLQIFLYYQIPNSIVKQLATKSLQDEIKNKNTSQGLTKLVRMSKNRSEKTDAVL